MIVATAGHIDHGKTALVRALTGVETDRLPEECARGITIDLGYAYTRTPDGASIGFIDVPGHERLVRTMLAGAVGVDLALLVIAADDGPMPQTHEHLALLDLLAVPRGIVVLTKSDRVDAARLAALGSSLALLLRGSVFETASILACSALTGAGIATLRSHLEAASAQVRPRAGGRFRLAVDRAFSLPGAGLIATGTIHSGAVRASDRLILSPAGLELRVRGLHVQNQAAGQGHAGQRCAVNVMAPRLERHDLQRGAWLVEPGAHAPTSRLDARLRLLPGEPRALRHWTPVHVHMGAADIPGRVGLLDERAVEPGGEAWIQLVLDTPTVAVHGDRFVIRDQSAQRSLGGGHIVDPFPPRRGARRPERLLILAALDRADASSALAALLDLSPAGLDLAWFGRARNLAEGEMRAIHGLTMLDALAFSSAHYAALRSLLLEAARLQAGTDPDSAGATPDELLRQLPPPLRTAGREALRVLAGEGVLQRHGPLLHLPGHVVRLSVAEESFWQGIRDVLAAAGTDPPRDTLLAERLQVRPDELQPLLRKLSRMGLLCRVSPTYHVLPDALRALAHAALTAAADGLLTVGRFREATGIGRNATMPVLEFFDKVGFTTRRVVRPDRTDLFE